MKEYKRKRVQKIGMYVIEKDLIEKILKGWVWKGFD